MTLLRNSPETSGASITGAKVTSMRSGSVVVDMTIASSGATLPLSSVESSINNGITKGNLSSLGASGTVTVQGISSNVFLVSIVSLQDMQKLNWFHLQKLMFLSFPFWTPGLPEGVLSNRPCPLVRLLVRGPSVFRYLRYHSMVPFNFLHEVRAP